MYGRADVGDGENSGAPAEERVHISEKLPDRQAVEETIGEGRKASED